MNDPRNEYRKNRSRLTPPRVPMPAYCWECRVLNRAQFTRVTGQIIEGGDTRKRRAIPPMEKPISCVDITTNHWSRTKFWSSRSQRKEDTIIHSWSCKSDYSRLSERRWCLSHTPMRSRPTPEMIYYMSPQRKDIGVTHTNHDLNDKWWIVAFYKTEKNLYRD